MAVTDPYATVELYRALLGKTDTADDTAILDDLRAVSRYLDRRLGRFFTKDASVTVRTYPASGTRTLNVEDIASTTGLVVQIDDDANGTAEVTLTAGTDFELLPRNADKGPEPGPFTQLYLPERVSRTHWAQLVKVTAIHGWPAVPHALGRGTAHITGILRLESPRATSRIPEGLDDAIESSREAQQIIDRLVSAYAKPAWIYS